MKRISMIWAIALSFAVVTAAGAATFRVEIPDEGEPPISPTQTLRPEDLEDRTKTLPPVVMKPPAPPAPPAMSAAQAAELLGVAPGTPPAEVRRHFQKLHNEIQVRITNTPSPSLRRMYQNLAASAAIGARSAAPAVRASAASAAPSRRRRSGGRTLR